MLESLIDRLKKRREELRDQLELVTDTTEHLILIGKVRALKEILTMVVEVERKLHEES